MAAFQKKVLDGVDLLQKSSDEQKKRGDTLQTNITKMLSDVDRLDKETKDVLKDIESCKKAANDTASNFRSMEQRFNMLDSRLQLQARSSFGDPKRFIRSNPEYVARLNIAARLLMTGGNGDLRRQANQIIEKADPSFRDKLRDDVKRALGEDSSPGSTTITDDLWSEVYHVLESYGIWNTFSVVPVSTKNTKFMVKTARPITLIIAENVQISEDSTKAGTSVTAETEKFATLSSVSLELLQDAEIDVTADLLDDFAEATAYRIDWCCTQADGTADTTDGGMTGVFGGGGTAANAGTGQTTVEGTNLTAWQNCLLTVAAGVLQRPAKWWMHPQILVRALSVQDGNGRPIFLTALEAPSAGAIGSILGYPVIPTAVAPTTNTAGSKVAAFGDPGGLVVGLSKQFMFESSDHLHWDYYQRTFRGIARAGVKVRAATAFGVLTLAAV